MSQAQVHRITSLEDPRVFAYRDMKERELARRGDRFIAEGELVTRRLLGSGYETESVFVIDRKLESIQSAVPENVPIFVADPQVMAGVMGFKFHSGVIACGRRGKYKRVEDLISKHGPALLVVCPNTNNTENLGSLVRIAAAFGADALVTGEQCADPFFRQAIRVSMGTVFSLPIVRSEDLRSDLIAMRDTLHIECVATVLDVEADPLDAFRPADRSAILLGNEAEGLGEWADLCDRRVTLPMLRGTDSLNVAVAAGVFLYAFTRRTMQA